MPTTSPPIATIFDSRHAHLPVGSRVYDRLYRYEITSYNRARRLRDVGSTTPKPDVLVDLRHVGYPLSVEYIPEGTLINSWEDLLLLPRGTVVMSEVRTDACVFVCGATAEARDVLRQFLPLRVMPSRTLTAIEDDEVLDDPADWMAGDRFEIRWEGTSTTISGTLVGADVVTSRNRRLLSAYFPTIGSVTVRRPDGTVPEGYSGKEWTLTVWKVAQRPVLPPEPDGDVVVRLAVPGERESDTAIHLAHHVADPEKDASAWICVRCNPRESLRWSDLMVEHEGATMTLYPVDTDSAGQEVPSWTL